MRLPDFLHFEPLDKVRQMMRAPLPGTFTFQQGIEGLTPVEYELLQTSGLSINIDNLRELEDRSLAYKTSRVLLYVREADIFSAQDPNAVLQKFHLSKCEALESITERKPLGHYAASIRKDGKFAVICMRGLKKPATCSFSVCKDCLYHLNYKGYAEATREERAKIYQAFSIDEYFLRYPMQVPFDKVYALKQKPLASLTLAESNPVMAGKKGWVCEECAVDLSAPAYRKYLHLHPVSNLEDSKALCLQCHTDKQHVDTEKLPDYWEFLKLYPTLKKRRTP